MIFSNSSKFRKKFKILSVNVFKKTPNKDPLLLNYFNIPGFPKRGYLDFINKLNLVL